MKRMIKFFVAFVIVINATVFAYANDLEKEGNVLKVIQKTESLYNVVFQTRTKQQVSIQFIDEQENVLYSEAIRTSNGFIKPLNLSGLPAGNYMVRLFSSSDTLLQEITILTAAQMYGDMVKLKSVGQSQFTLAVDEKAGKTFSLYIKDAKGEILYQDDVGCKDVKVYDLGKLVGDKVTFTLYDGQDKVKEQQVEL